MFTEIAQPFQAEWSVFVVIEMQKAVDRSKRHNGSLEECNRILLGFSGCVLMNSLTRVARPDD